MVCTGRMDPDTAAKAIDAGYIDAMGVARQFLTDPQWVSKLIDERLEDIKPCICCHLGCFNFAHYGKHANDQSLSDTCGLARCALTPAHHAIQKYRLVPAKKQKI